MGRKARDRRPSESGLALKEWCTAKYGRWAALAREVGVSRQMLHLWADGSSPSDEYRHAVHEATGGAVSKYGWNRRIEVNDGKAA